MIAHTSAGPTLSAAAVCGGVPTQQYDNTTGVNVTAKSAMTVYWLAISISA